MVCGRLVKKPLTYFGNKRLRSVLKVVVGLALIVLVFQAIDVPRLASLIVQIDIRFLLLAVLMYFIQNLVLSFRLFRCLNSIGHSISWTDTFWSHLFGMLWGHVTPGQAGYAVLTYHLSKKKGIPVTESLSCLGTIEAIELVFKAATGSIGLLFFVYYISDPTFIFLAFAGILIILFMSVTFLVLCWTDVEILNRMVGAFPFFGKKILDLIGKFRSASQVLKSKAPFIAVISLVGWLLRGVEWSFLGYACQINLSYVVFLMLHPLLTAVRYVPLTPAGLGMFEGVTILGFSFFGVSPENALLFSLFDRVDNAPIDLLAIKEMKRL